MLSPGRPPYGPRPGLWEEEGLGRRKGWGGVFLSLPCWWQPLGAVQQSLHSGTPVGLVSRPWWDFSSPHTQLGLSHLPTSWAEKCQPLLPRPFPGVGTEPQKLKCPPLERAGFVLWIPGWGEEGCAHSKPAGLSSGHFAAINNPLLSVPDVQGWEVGRTGARSFPAPSGGSEPP